MQVSVRLICVQVVLCVNGRKLYYSKYNSFKFIPIWKINSRY